MIGDEQEAIAWLKSLPEADSVAMERLTRLIASLAEENERQNLVAKSSLAQVWRRHIIDSVQLLQHVPRGTTSSWMDLGTGAGFPGLIIAILRPELQVTMVESRVRRTEWLADMCETLQLDQAKVAASKLEALASTPAAVISARAFAPLEVLVEKSTRFSTSETLWLLPKGRSAAQELANLRGWSHTFHVEPSLTDPEAGIIIGTLSGRKGAQS